MRSKKGQISLSDAPGVVMIVGLVFLMMATLAFVGNRYGAAMPTDSIGNVTNETITNVNHSGSFLASRIRSQCNFESLNVKHCLNATDNGAIPSGNYTVSADGLITYIGANDTAGYNSSSWKCSYSYRFTGTTCNITGDLESELLSNTSIAGIILTISLVGIILSVLVGIFVASRRGGL